MSLPSADLSWPVITERLQIRPAVAGDAEAVFGYRVDPETSRWLPSAPRRLGDFQAYFSDPDRLRRTLIIERPGRDHRGRDDPEVIGDLMVAVQDAWAQLEVAERARGVQAEIGWCLSPSATGHGYATEAVRALITWCFDELGLRRVMASSFAANVASVRLMRRLGMRVETQTRADALHRSGEWMDGVTCALLAEEWRAAGDPG